MEVTETANVERLLTVLTQPDSVMPIDKRLAAVANDKKSTRAEKIECFVRSGRQPATAERMADGKPEWGFPGAPDTSPDPTQSEAYKQQTANNRAAVRPSATLGELETQLEKIQDEQRYWAGVVKDAQDDVDALSLRLNAANDVLVSVREIVTPLTSQEKRDRQDAMDTVDRVEPKLAAAKKRLFNASGQVKERTRRLNAFPHALHSKLKSEDTRRERMKGKLK